MSIRILAVAGCILFASTCFGQDIAQGSAQVPAQRSWRFRSDNFGGIAIGELGSYGQVETVNGVYKGPWFLGLGTGLDFYRFRTVPLYLSVTRDLFGVAKNGGFFLTLNGGVSLPWFTSHPLPVGIESSTFSTGKFWTGGLGYRQKLSAKTDKALLFMASYEVKNLIEHQKGFDCTGCMYTPENPPTYEYDYMNRVFLVSVGFQF